MNRPTPESDRHDDAVLANLIREAGDPQVEPEAEHVERLRQTLLARARPTAEPGARLRRRRSVLVLAAVAAAVLVAVVFWTGRTSRGWAAVVRAVRAMPWIHGTAEGPEGEPFELWLSPQREVAAFRHGEFVQYDDFRLGLRQTYEPEEKVVYRLLIEERMTEQSFRSMQETFQAIFQGKGKLIPPLPGVEIVEQTRREIVAEGRTWVEYEMTVGQGKVASQLQGTVRLVFRVDPDTRLPASMQVTIQRPEAEPESLRYAFEYPETGPADIYALGVPQTVELVDRVPQADLARLVEGSRAGRERFGPYYAVVAQTVGSDDYWNSAEVHRVWRDGDRWRVETGSPGPDWGKTDKPPEGADMLAWWQKRLEKFRFQPVSICDGRTAYYVKGGLSEAGDEPQLRWKPFCDVLPGHGVEHAGSLGVAGSRMVELFAYPTTFGMPSERFQVELEPNPDDGPPGTVRLDYRATRRLGVHTFHTMRYWIDPLRSYVTCRYELGSPGVLPGSDGKAPEAGAGRAGSASDRSGDLYAEVMDQITRSPHGVWYPTVVRRQGVRYVDGRPEPTGTEVATWFFLDFEASMPDALFQVDEGAVVQVDPASRGPVGLSAKEAKRLVLSRRHLAEIALAMHRHHEAQGHFPAPANYDDGGKPLLSWRVHILPYLGQKSLHDQFHLDEPWDSPHNRPLIAEIPDVYVVPVAAGTPAGATVYLMPRGKGTLFEKQEGPRIEAISDGCASTILVVEADVDRAVPWTKPDDLDFDPADPWAGLGHLRKEGFLAMFADASQRWVPAGLPADSLHALFTSAAGDEPKGFDTGP